MQTEFNTQIVDRIVIWIVDTTWTVDIPTTDTPWDLDIAGTIWIKIPQTSSIAPIADIPKVPNITRTIKVVCTGGITLTADTPKAPYTTRTIKDFCVVIQIVAEIVVVIVGRLIAIQGCGPNARPESVDGKEKRKSPSYSTDHLRGLIIFQGICSHILRE